MKINFHCRGCNEQGSQNIEMNEIIKERKLDESLLDVIMRKIIHDCPKRDLGVRTT